MERPKDYYRILGIPRDASPNTIRRAYRKLAQQLRPGSKSDKSAEAFLELQAAYETLIDADRRRQHDERLEAREPRRVPAWSLLRPPRAHGLRRPVRRGSLSAEILLAPDEAASGGVLPLDIPLSSSCSSCDGTGGRYLDCGECGGRGALDRRLPVSLRIPPGVRDGAVFQIGVDDDAVDSVLLTVHLRAV
jgi:molecular chaperone DnaJ